MITLPVYLAVGKGVRKQEVAVITANSGEEARAKVARALRAVADLIEVGSDLE